MRKSHGLWGAALLLGALAGAALAQIKSMTLEEMVQTADQAVYGEIIGSRVFRVDSPVDGPELYYTTITIQGTKLYDSTPITVDVTFGGGLLSETEGVFNSEAPAADDVKVGKRVVAFYQWTDNAGGGVACNALVAAHGGLFRTVDGPRGPAVLGRGEGYAISRNLRLEQLTTAVRTLAAQKPKR